MDMKIPSIFLVLSILTLSYGSKESFQDLDQLLSDPNIWQYIEKRVSNKEKSREENDKQEKRPIDRKNPEKHEYREPFSVPNFKETHENDKPPVKNKAPEKNKVQDGIKTLVDSSGNSCSYRPQYSMIIRSKTSLNDGAFFLKSILGLSSEQCAEKCCYTQNCNLAVYEDKDEHSCYLFDCDTPSKCSFAHHGNYTVMSFSSHNYQPYQHQQYHENELESLGKVTTTRPTTAVPTTKAPKYETPAPIPPRVKVPLFGDCNTIIGEHCGNRNAICDDGQCVCKKGFHAVEAYCREICNKDDEFRCKNIGKDDTVPDCIDIKYKCDGVPQCADDSDEEECPVKTTESDGNKSIGINNGSKLSMVQSVIPTKVVLNKVQKPNNQPVLLPNTDKMNNIAANQFYGQLPDKTGYINPNLYGNGNPLIPKQIQDYYWPPQQGLLNNQQYQAPYQDYPQFQGQQLGQGYMNNLGFSGQRYNNPFNSGTKTDNANLNSNFYGAYSPNLPNQNVPMQKYPVNQGYDKTVGNSDYQNSLKHTDDDSNSYSKYDLIPPGQYPGLSQNRNWLENKQKPYVQPTARPTSTSTVQSTTTTTASTTTTTTTTTTPAPVVMTTRIKHFPKDRYDDNFYNAWSGNSESYYPNNRQHNMKNSQKSHKIQNSEGRHHGSRVHNSGEDKPKSFQDRYPYRFPQKGKYPDYDDRYWPDYYDDKSEYSDIHQYPRPGGKYDNQFDKEQQKLTTVYQITPSDEKQKHKHHKFQVYQTTPSYGVTKERYRCSFGLCPKRSIEKQKHKHHKFHVNHGTPSHDSKESEEHKEPKIPVDDKEPDENEPEDKPTSRPPWPILPHKDNSKEMDDHKSDEEVDEENKEDLDSDKKVQKTNEKQDSVTKSTAAAIDTPKVPKTTTVTANLEGPQKVKVISPTDSNQGPIVALALGLGICLMLLIFVGCRLRTVKRRLRRGKSLHSNEADYLINGMYL